MGPYVVIWLSRRFGGPRRVDLILSLYGVDFIFEQVPRMITAINLVAAGLGISLVPRSMRALHKESVVYRKLAAGSLPPAPLTLVFRRDNPSVLVRNFIDVARTASHAI